MEPQKPGTYLVRVSLTDPEKTPFTISKVGKDGKISHQRINIMKDRSGFYVYLKSSKGQKKIEAQGGLEALINTVRNSTGQLPYLVIVLTVTCRRPPKNCTSRSPVPARNSPAISRLCAKRQATTRPPTMKTNKHPHPSYYNIVLFVSVAAALTDVSLQCGAKNNSFFCVISLAVFCITLLLKLTLVTTRWFEVVNLFTELERAMHRQ